MHLVDDCVDVAYYVCSNLFWLNSLQSDWLASRLSTKHLRCLHLVHLDLDSRRSKLRLLIALATQHGLAFEQDVECAVVEGAGLTVRGIDFDVDLLAESLSAFRIDISLYE